MPLWGETQSAFADALFVPSKAAPEDVCRTVPGAVQSKRFDVYRNNVVTAAIDALAETFPACQTLVGEEFFRALARAFLDVAPPSSPILSQIGVGFADFLNDFPPAQQVPYLADVARIEHARVVSYHSADAEPLDLSVLAALAPETVGAVTLKPHPSSILIRSRYPAGSLWAASMGEIDSDHVDMNRMEDVLIVRPALRVDTVILPPGGGQFLTSLFAGWSITQAAEEAAQEIGEEAPEFDLDQHLAGAFGAGAFVHFGLPETTPSL